jgi:hypothetical protein
MHTRPTSRALRTALPLALACLALVVPGAGAIVPPADCGRLTAKAKRYDIKADQLRCKTARSYAASYLKTGHKPSGYRCRNYGAETKLKFRCSRGVKVFFAIRR